MTDKAVRKETAASDTTLKLIGLAAIVVRYAVPWVSLCLALYLFVEVVHAAMSPGADVLVNTLSNVSRTRALAFVFGFLGTLYGIRERNLRRVAVRRLKSRVDQLERELIAARTPHD